MLDDTCVKRKPYRGGGDREGRSRGEQRPFGRFGDGGKHCQAVEGAGVEDCGTSEFCQLSVWVLGKGRREVGNRGLVGGRQVASGSSCFMSER